MGKNILIIQSYNVNKGDNSVISVMLSTLKESMLNISLTAFDPEKAKRDHHVDAYDYLFSFRDMKLAKNKLLFIVAGIKAVGWFFYSLLVLLFLKIGITLPLNKEKKAVIESYRKADVVVIPGGHFFTSFNSLINNFSHYYALRFAQILGKKTMVYSQTIGPFYDNFSGRIERRMGIRVLSKSDIVTVREEDSLKCYSGSNVRMTAETVFLEPVEKREVNISQYINNSDSSLIIGCTIHHIYFKHFFSKVDYVSKMVDIFNSILSECDCHLLIIPMEDNIKAGGDRPIIKEMMGLVEKKERIHMVTDDLDSMDTANIISKTDLFIGTKTHSIVYGLKTSTPTISISYQQKSTEFMKMFDMERYAIPLKDLNTNTFMSIFRNVLKDRDVIKTHLTVKYPEIQRAAEENNKLLLELADDRQN